MVIRLDENYNAMTSTALLGYVGETNARPVSVEGMEIDGADRYVMTIDYGDGVQYEVDITGGTWTPTADILRSAQTVSCQIAAKKLSGDEYVLVKKSRIFRLRIGAAIGDTAIPSPSVAADALDRIDAIGRQAHADMQTAVTAAETATTAAENAKKSATAAGLSADTATQAAKRAETAQASAETAAQKAQSIADSLPDDYVTAVGKIAENTAEIANVKLTDKELQRRVNALYDMGQGITHRFETDSDTAYAKTIPTGAKLMSVKSIGGHSEVIDGEIVSAGTESIIEQGANLYYGTDMLKVGSDTYEYIANSYRCKAIKLKPNTTYTLSFTSDKTSEIILLMNVNTVVNSQPYLDFRKTSDNRSYRTGDNGCLYVGVYAGNGSVASADVVKRLSECEIMISEGDTPTAYAPFHRNEYPIPEAIKALPGYGWSAGTARNYVDYENKKYVQCVSSVDLGALNWTYGNLPFGWGDNQWFSASIQSIKVILTNTQLANVICKKYTTRCAYVTDGNDFFRVDKSIGQYQGAARVTVLDTAYTDATTFKQAMSGVMLYYELEKPIVTDISSLIPDDFLRNIEVEAGGSVTFKGGNDSYRIPVPSEEEYIVKLSEVGGSV